MRYKTILVFFLLVFSGCSVKWANQTAEKGFDKEAINQYDDALKLYNTAIFFNKKSVLTYWRRAGIYYRYDEFQNAITDLNKAIEIDSTFNSGYLFGDRGDAKERIGDIQGAINDYSVAIKLCKIEPNRPTSPKERFFYNRAIAYINLGDTISALNDLDSAIFYWDNMARAIWLRAKLKTQLKNYSEAMLDYKKMPLGRGQERFDYYADDFYYQGLAKYNTGDSTFCEDWRVASKYDFQLAITSLNKYCN